MTNALKLSSLKSLILKDFDVRNKIDVADRYSILRADSLGVVLRMLNKYNLKRLYSDSTSYMKGYRTHIHIIYDRCPVCNCPIGDDGYCGGCPVLY